MIASDMVDVLSQHGAHIVGPAPTVLEATGLVRAYGPRLAAAVLDVDLRGEMIFPVAGTLENYGVPFLFTTGYDQSVIPQRFSNIIRCEKPVHPQDVANILVRLCRLQ